MRLASLVVVAAACGPSSPRPAAPAVEAEAEAPASEGGCAPEACVIEAEATIGQRDHAPGAVAANQRALAVFDAACRDGSARGCERAAELRLDGPYYGIDRDDAAAAVAFDRACKLGSMHACYRYGFYLAEGVIDFVVEDGAPRPYHWDDDRFLGLELLELACEHGESGACEEYEDASQL